MLSQCKNKDLKPNTIKEAVDQVTFPHIAFGSNVGIMVGVIKHGEKSVYSYGERELGSRELLNSQSVF